MHDATWLALYRDGLSAHRQSPIQVLTGPGVEQLDSTQRVTATPRHQPRSAKRILAIVILSACPVPLSRPGTGSSPVEIETLGFHRMLA